MICIILKTGRWDFDFKILFLTFFKGFVNKNDLLKDKGKRDVEEEITKRAENTKKCSRRKIIFGIEITVLLILSGILFVYAWINRSMDKMNQDTLDSSQIQINSEVKANTDLSQMSGTQVIALVGVDARGVKGSELAESMNSDTIILCCIDHDKQEIRMVSIMRDTWMNMAKYTDEYYEFDKANSASTAAARRVCSPC